MTKIDSQKRIVRNMISLYSRHTTGTYKLNGSYKELAEYCERRLDHCYWGNKKPSCKNCSIHCYNKAKREEIKKIMKWAGPRMIIYHPIQAIRHLFNI